MGIPNCIHSPSIYNEVQDWLTHSCSTLNAKSCKEMKPSAYLHLLEESEEILNTPEDTESCKYETIYMCMWLL